jgi:four helix bundle protein
MDMMENKRPTVSYNELLVWQKANELATLVYKVTSKYPKHEQYGLTSQIRRASASVSANIAEGYKRFGKNEKVRFLNIAESSLTEVSSYIQLAKNLGYPESTNIELLVTSVGKLLTAYKMAILRDINRSKKR